MALLCVSLTAPAWADPPPTSAAAPKILHETSAETDRPLWRATHGVLLAIANAGSRIVAVGDRGIVLLSEDDGRGWKQAPSGTDVLLTSLVFTSATEGFAVGQDATILHTTDAGATWTSQHAAPGGDQALFSIAASGPHHLIATGAYALALETQDGANWATVKLPEMDEDYHLNCVIARSDDVIVTGEGGHAFWRHDGAWQAVPVPYGGSQFGCLEGPGGNVFSFGLRGSLFEGVPGVHAWTRDDTGTQQSFFGGTILKDGRLVLVGGNGLVLRYDPTARTATKLPPPTSSTLSGVTEAADGSLIAVGEDGIHIIDSTAPGEVMR